MNNKFLKLPIKNIAWCTALAIFFLIDRYLKTIALSSYNQPIINNLINFNFVPNYQIAFSLPVSGPWLSILISSIIIIITIYLALNYKKLKSLEFISLFGIALGATSNLIDRINYGFVIDYLDLRWFTIFNIADVLISVCSIILFINLMQSSKKDSLV
jgi:signal peptidase II